MDTEASEARETHAVDGRLSPIEAIMWKAGRDARLRMTVGVVMVLDPRDYNLKGGELKLDMECTIVHELVHVQVSPLAAPNEHVREEVVNKIMTALLNRSCPN